MRKIHIDYITPEMRLAKSIFTSDGRVLLTAGTELKESYFKNIRDTGIAEVYIEDEISKNVQIPDVICEQTMLEAKILVKNVMESYIFINSIHAGRIKKIVGEVIEEILSNCDILACISDIRSVDDYTFEHSVSVCILSLIAGINLGYGKQRLKDLGVGALLHDIGKLRVPVEILKKPSQLTAEEFEEIKKHTIYGYEMLRDNKNLSMVSVFIALGHHERFDGSGYPLQLKGENIHQCARIVAVADVYDALTSDRVYRKKVQPYEVIEYISSLGSHHFDILIVNKFTRFLSIYPMGTGVELNTKERGLIVGINRKEPARPLVRILYNRWNEKLEDYYEIDLMKNSNIYILSCCEL